MNRTGFALLLCMALLLLTIHSDCHGAYKIPPSDIVKIIDSPAPPAGFESPDGCFLLLLEQTIHPPLKLLVEPRIPLAGLEINPRQGALFCKSLYPGLSLMEVRSRKLVKLELPDDANISVPSWSHDGKFFAFTNQGESGLELYVGSAEDGRLRTWPRLRVTNILDTPFAWQKDGRLLVRLVPDRRGDPPKSPEIPAGPTVEETSGKFSKVSTYQNLLRNEQDEKLFEYYAASQPAFLNVDTGTITEVGMPGLYLNSSVSPDGNFILVTRLHRPFSYKVPYYYFAKTTEVWDRSGKPVRQIASRPVEEEIPPEGVPTGPRGFMWQPLSPARLLWVEALDGGDPLREVPFRDALVSLEAPFKEKPRELLKIAQRYYGIQFFPVRDLVILSEFERKRQWLSTSLVDLTHPGNSRILNSRNIRDDYNDPGSPVYRMYDNRDWLIDNDGEDIYYYGKGSSPSGERPFLARFNVKTAGRTIIFQSAADAYERFITFCGASHDKIITRSESAHAPPNYNLRDLKTGESVALTHYEDPTPELRGITEEIVQYKRKDGVILSGMLYLPAGYVKGTRVPVVIWAYPYEYTDSSVAGQVRGSPHRFTFLRGASQLFFLTRGYAVLNNAAMPVVGDPDTKNDTFVEQIVTSAEAAINYLDSRGILEKGHVLVGGHSYGAFMTANLLAHSRLFAAGIARSGAYNRSLTPFGFQNERRSFWEAPDVYMKVSPFTYADKIKDPLLLIHGEEDENSGTFPLQSERLFDAIKGNGGTARLVFLPAEGHAYYGRESILHVIAEMLEWGDRFVKQRTEGGLNEKQ